MPRKSRKNVGLIGLGIIGSCVVSALRFSGYHVYVWNRTPRAAPNFLSSPAEVAQLCDVVQLFIADSEALFEVLETMAATLTAQHVVICSATVGPEATVEAAKLVQGRGASFLDAPFTGSKMAAENRELVYYIGGDDETFQRAEPILRASSKEIVRLGKIGEAATLKVATNMLAAVSIQTLAEALAIVKASGISPDLFTVALEHHGIRSAVADMKLEKMLRREYEPHFALRHMFKDVQLGIHIANSFDVDVPATTATAGVMYGALTRGWADLDFSALAKAYETDKERAEDAEKAARVHAAKEAAAAATTAAAGAAAAGAPPAPVPAAETTAQPPAQAPAPDTTKQAESPAPEAAEKNTSPPRETLGDSASAPPQPPPGAAHREDENEQPQTDASTPTTATDAGASAAPPATAAAAPVEPLAENEKPSDAVESGDKTAVPPVLATSTGPAPSTPADAPLLSMEELKATGASPGKAVTPEHVALEGNDAVESGAAGSAEAESRIETPAKADGPFDRLRRWFTPDPH